MKKSLLLAGLLFFSAAPAMAQNWADFYPSGGVHRFQYDTSTLRDVTSRYVGTTSGPVIEAYYRILGPRQFTRGLGWHTAVVNQYHLDCSDGTWLQTEIGMEDQGKVVKRTTVPAELRKWKDSEGDKFDRAFTDKVCQIAHDRGLR
jgi:hypothetical protein